MNLRTAQAIIDVAYGRSKRADPNAGDTTIEELLVKLDEIMGTYCQAGARINPDYFGKRIPVDFNEDTGGWARPREAEAILRIENTSGTEIANVPYEDRDAEAGTAVYAYGRTYHPKDQTGPSGQLVFYSAVRPAFTASAESEIDEIWPHGHETLLALELAMYIAAKDERADALALLAPQRDRQLLRFQNYMEHEDTTKRYRKSRAKKFSTGSLKPVMPSP